MEESMPTAAVVAAPPAPPPQKHCKKRKIPPSDQEGTSGHRGTCVANNRAPVVKKKMKLEENEDTLRDDNKENGLPAVISNEPSVLQFLYRRDGSKIDVGQGSVGICHIGLFGGAKVVVKSALRSHTKPDMLAEAHISTFISRQCPYLVLSHGHTSAGQCLSEWIGSHPEFRHRFSEDFVDAFVLDQTLGRKVLSERSSFHSSTFENLLYDFPYNEYFLKITDAPDYKLSSVFNHWMKGIEFLHESGYYHGDLVVQNVYIQQNAYQDDDDWIPVPLGKIGDFGRTRLRTEFIRLYPNSGDPIANDIKSFSTMLFEFQRMTEPLNYIEPKGLTFLVGRAKETQASIRFKSIDDYSARLNLLLPGIASNPQRDSRDNQNQYVISKYNWPKTCLKRLPKD